MTKRNKEQIRRQIKRFLKLRLVTEEVCQLDGEIICGHVDALSDYALDELIDLVRGTDIPADVTENTENRYTHSYVDPVAEREAWLAAARHKKYEAGR